MSTSSAQAEPLDRECAVCSCLSHKPHCPSPSRWVVSQHKVQCGVPHNSAGCNGLHLLEGPPLKDEALLLHWDPTCMANFNLMSAMVSFERVQIVYEGPLKAFTVA